MNNNMLGVIPIPTNNPNFNPFNYQENLYTLEKRIYTLEKEITRLNNFIMELEKKINTNIENDTNYTNSYQSQSYNMM